MEGLHKFAHAKYHARGMAWWAMNKKFHPEISIMHETYEVPPGHWENVYVNYHPSGMGASLPFSLFSLYIYICVCVCVCVCVYACG